MSRSSYERIMGRPPRIMELMGRHDGDPMLGRKAVSKSEQRRRADPIVAGVADGSVPLDELSGRLVADALEGAYRDMNQETS